MYQTTGVKTPRGYKAQESYISCCKRTLIATVYSKQAPPVTTEVHDHFGLCYDLAQNKKGKTHQRKYFMRSSGIVLLYHLISEVLTAHHHIKASYLNTCDS